MGNFVSYCVPNFQYRVMTLTKSACYSQIYPFKGVRLINIRFIMIISVKSLITRALTLSPR